MIREIVRPFETSNTKDHMYDVVISSSVLCLFVHSSQGCALIDQGL
jgi:hypothetical protein